MLALSEAVAAPVLASPYVIGAADFGGWELDGTDGLQAPLTQEAARTYAGVMRITAAKLTKISTDTGVSGDFVTNDNTLVLSGTDVTTAAGSLGIWLSGGTYGSGTLIGSVSLAAGLPSLSTQALVVDVNSPAAPDGLALIAASDSGAADRITNVRTPTIAGTAEPGRTVRLYDTNGTTVLGTTTADAITGDWSISSATLSNGVHSLTAKAADTAGNASAGSVAMLVTIDGCAVRPIAPRPRRHNGQRQVEHRQRHQYDDLDIRGTAETGSAVTIYADGVSVGSGTAVGGTYNITTSILGEGLRNITAAATDIAGNTSKMSAALGVRIDTRAPLAPSKPVMTAASDTGASNSDNITRKPAPVFTGTAEAGSTVTLYDSNGTTVLGTGKANATTGMWSIASASLTDGVHTIRANAVDVAGNVGPASQRDVTIDAQPPSAPVSLGLTAASDLGVSAADGITNVKTPTIAGMAEAGATVRLYDTNGTTILGTTIADAITGAWSITSTTLSNGVHSLTAKATDIAGNTSAVSAARLVTIDVTAPAAPPQPDLLAASDSGTSSTDNITKLTMPSFAGTAETGSVVTIYADGLSVGSAIAVGGTYTISC